MEVPLDATTPPADRHAEPVILAVDDEEPNLSLLRSILRREGYPSPHTTRDPHEAAGLFDSLRPDLVLLDIRMPGMDGFAVMEQIRRSPHAAGYLPILMLTGDTSPSARQRALGSGATDLVLKPFDVIEVALRIRNLLETRRLHQAVQGQNQRLEDQVRVRTGELEAALVRAEAAREAKVQFLAKMSHELRTPLNPIRGALEMIGEDATPAQTRLLAMAGRNLDRMARLIDDILYLQSIEQGNVRPERYPVQLPSLMREVAGSFAERAAATGVGLELSIPAGLPAVSGDAELLTEVLRRLVDNAIRFAGPGTVTLAVRENPPGAPSAIEVRDDGPGIEPARMAGLFEAFEQGDNSSTRRFEGAGLGLSISRALCERMGYRLTGASAPGSGATFAVELEPAES